MPTQQTTILVLVAIALLLMNYLTLRGALYSPYRVTTMQYRLGVTSILLFCVFSFWGTDWFHYLEVFPILQSGYKNSNIEDVYVWIAQNLSPNYLVFRLVIWGSAFFLYLQIIKRLSVSRDLALCLFGCIFVIWFSYARVSLAMVLAYYGITLLYKPYQKRLLSYILAVICIAVSFYFHKSALFGIAMVFMTVLTRQFGNKVLLLFILLFPLGVYMAQSFIVDMLVSEADMMEGDIGTYLAVGQRYMEVERGQSGIGALFVRFFERFQYYWVAFLCLRVGTSGVIKRVPDDIKAFMRLTFFIVLSASIFAFDLNVNTSTIYTRFLRFAAIPSVIVLAYMHKEGLFPKLTRKAIFFAGFSTVCSVGYSLYNTIV